MPSVKKWMMAVGGRSDLDRSLSAGGVERQIVPCAGESAASVVSRQVIVFGAERLRYDTPARLFVVLPMQPLADIIEANRDSLVTQWIAAVARSLAPGHVRSTPELADHMPSFLDKIVAALRRVERRAEDSPIDGKSAVGREHGAQRFRLGFELEAVVREYGFLVHVVLDLIESADATVSTSDVRRLTDLVTNAVAEATAEYARREVESARRQRSESDRYKAQLETTLQSMGDGVIATDASGKITLFNSAAERLTGWSAREAIGQPIEAVVRLEDAETHSALPSPTAPVLRGEPKPELSANTQLVRRDGTRFAMADSLAPIGDSSGGIAGAVLVFRDETETRRKDEELRTFRAVVEASTDFISFGGVDGGAAYINPAGLRLVGLEPSSGEAASELASLRVGDFYPDHLRKDILETIRPLLRAGQPFQGETALRHFKTGEEIPVSQSAFTVNDASGRPIVQATVIRDRRESERAILALQRSEANFRTLAEAIPQQVWTSLPDGKFDSVNQRTLDYFGQAREQVLGAGWLTMVHAQDREGCIERWSHCLSTGETYEYEFRLRRADGAYRWHLSRAVAVHGADGHIVKWFGTNTDIDEAKKAREDLQRRTEFEQYLVGIVSHDLRNPLGVISMGAGLLLQMDELSDRANKTAQRIRSSAQRSERMIRDLLDFTQTRLGGGIPIERRPADLYAITSAAIEDVRAAFPERTVELLRSGDVRGTWDGDRLAQLVSNLVANALKYGAPGKPVRVEVAREGGRVTLSVHNAGAPIPAERLGRIFEPLQRASEQNDRKARSVGLGLYIVDAIARAHGGTVSVTSDEGGTTFLVTLSVESSEPPPRT